MLLIDTHVFIWMLYHPENLSEYARHAIMNNNLALSIASLWEMSIKKTLGQIEFDETIPELAAICTDQGIDILPIKPEHLQKIQALRLFHRDPFDRLIIAQSLIEGCPLITHDGKIKKGYPEVNVIW